MVSKITVTLAILLLIGLINQSFAHDDKDARLRDFLNKTSLDVDYLTVKNLTAQSKLRCYIGVTVNPKNASDFSPDTVQLKNCNEIHPADLVYQNANLSSVKNLACTKVTYINDKNDTIVSRTCSVAIAQSCNPVEPINGTACHCHGKDGCNSSSKSSLNIVFLIMSFAVIIFFFYN